MRCVGVDGWKNGWVAVVTQEGRFERALVEPRLESVLAAEPDAACVAVDMPLGLVAEGERAADAAARAFLGKKRSSLFPVPPRSVVETGGWDAALVEAKRVWGKGISKQVFYLFPKILELDGLLADERLVEVHPEIAFAVMNAGAPLPSKKTWGGQRARARVLSAHGIALPDDLGAANVVPPDDVLDAAAAAWSAARVARGQARSFPADEDQRDRSGRRIAILA